MGITDRIKTVCAATCLLGAMATTVYAEQWNGPPNPNGTIWRPGQVALGLAPTGAGDSHALLALKRPLSGEKELLFSAGAIFKEATSDRFEIDTERAYAGGARSRASLLYPDIDFAVHHKAVMGSA